MKFARMQRPEHSINSLLSSETSDVMLICELLPTFKGSTCQVKILLKQMKPQGNQRIRLCTSCVAIGYAGGSLLVAIRDKEDEDK